MRTEEVCVYQKLSQEWDKLINREKPEEAKECISFFESYTMWWYSLRIWWYRVIVVERNSWQASLLSQRKEGIYFLLRLSLLVSPLVSAHCLSTPSYSRFSSRSHFFRRWRFCLPCFSCQLLSVLSLSSSASMSNINTARMKAFSRRRQKRVERKKRTRSREEKKSL